MREVDTQYVDGMLQHVLLLPYAWKAKVTKATGLAYVSRTGKLVKAKLLRRPMYCAKKDAKESVKTE